MAIKLSITIITLNEERIIGQSLEAVKHIAEEIVVVEMVESREVTGYYRSYGRYLQLAEAQRILVAPKEQSKC